MSIGESELYRAENYTFGLRSFWDMTDETFTDPEDATDEWIDVRMTEPEAEEWDLDLVVVDGQVNYVDLRIRPELLTSFVECLVDDISEDRARKLLTTMRDRKGIDLGDRTDDTE